MSAHPGGGGGGVILEWQAAGDARERGDEDVQGQDAADAYLLGRQSEGR